MRVAPARGRRGAVLTPRARALPRAGLLARRHDDRVPRRTRAAYLVTTDWSLEPGHLLGARGRRRQADARDARRLRAAVRRGQRPRLLHALRRRGRQGGGEARRSRASASTARELREHLAERRRDGVPRSRRTRSGSPSASASTRTSRRSCATGHACDDRPEDARRSRWRASRKDAGEYLHWSGDSTASHWSLGPRALHARPDGRLRVPARARRRSCPSAPEKGRNIGFEAGGRHAARDGRARRRAHRHDAGRRGDRETARSSSRATASPRSARRARSPCRPGRASST